MKNTFVKIKASAEFIEVVEALAGFLSSGGMRGRPRRGTMVGTPRRLSEAERTAVRLLAAHLREHDYIRGDE